MAKHPRMLEAIENAKKAASSTRGMYPYTPATNVFTKDGAPIEDIDSSAEVEEPIEDEDEGEEETTEE